MCVWNYSKASQQHPAPPPSCVCWRGQSPWRPKTHRGAQANSGVFKWLPFQPDGPRQLQIRQVVEINKFHDQWELYSP